MQDSQLWSHETSIETTATPARVWQLFADVAGWKQWNAGIERIELHGPFADGSTFEMQPPGEDAFTSTLLEVREHMGFSDRTELGDTTVLVQHRIETIAAGRTRVSYRSEVRGPAAGDIGPMVTADFPQVLAALKQRAESGAERGAG